MNMTYDIIKRSLVVIISLAFVAYGGFLFSTWATAVQADSLGMNIPAILIMMAVAIYMGYVYGLVPMYHRYQKRTSLVLGLFLIFWGHYMMINDPSQFVYAADICKLFWVLMIWFGATGILAKNKKIQDKKKHQHIEIIEA